MAKLVRQYTEAEVGKILKESEGHALSDNMGQGHSEGLHELVAVGKGRDSTSVGGLEQRLLDERKEVTGAFDGCQVKAITWALNSQPGQNTLQYLNGNGVWYVFAFIDISSQQFKMKEATSNLPGKKKEQGPMTQPVVTDMIAQFIAMKLMREQSGDLHIRTAYPMSGGPQGGQSKCQICYAGGTSLDQELPA